MPEAGPLGETFFEASERAIAGALLVKRSLGGRVESVVTVLTQRFFELRGDVDFFFVDFVGMGETRVQGSEFGDWESAVVNAS
jgi:hypothetical protein